MCIICIIFHPFPRENWLYVGYIIFHVCKRASWKSGHITSDNINHFFLATFQLPLTIFSLSTLSLFSLFLHVSPFLLTQNRSSPLYRCFALIYYYPSLSYLVVRIMYILFSSFSIIFLRNLTNAQLCYVTYVYYLFVLIQNLHTLSQGPKFICFNSRADAELRKI